jgi:hypothetical protein
MMVDARTWRRHLRSRGSSTRAWTAKLVAKLGKTPYVDGLISDLERPIIGFAQAVSQFLRVGCGAKDGPILTRFRVVAGRC